MKPHEPNDATRETVQMLAVNGVPQAIMAKLLGISRPTLEKHYREELRFGVTSANAEAAGHLFRQVRQGNITAIIFWLKCRAGWKDTSRLEVARPEEMTDDELIAAAECAIERAKEARSGRPGRASGDAARN